MRSSSAPRARSGIGLLVTTAAMAGIGLALLTAGWLGGGLGAASPLPVPVPTPPPSRDSGIVVGQGDGVVDWSDGVLTAGSTPFDTAQPGIGNLDADLRAALQAAATAANTDGYRVVINSAWRSIDYQEQLLDEAVERYGSRTEAARWVATPETSSHVAGTAVDLGPAPTVEWFAEHGAEYGLCQVYTNEPWHFELRPAAQTEGCPRPFADPTMDPRLQ